MEPKDSIAKNVVDKFNNSGKLIIPDGYKGAAVSLPQSSDREDDRRSLHIVFEDGSDITIELYGAQLYWSPANEHAMETLDAFLAGRRS